MHSCHYCVDNNRQEYKSREESQEVIPYISNVELLLLVCEKTDEHHDGDYHRKAECFSESPTQIGSAHISKP